MDLLFRIGTQHPKFLMEEILQDRHDAIMTGFSQTLVVVAIQKVEGFEQPGLVAWFCLLCVFH
eukprot:4214961-Prorocentrum_lima.AAC.1